MGRPSDPIGKEMWVNSVADGATGASIAEGFIYSPEFQLKQQKMSDADYVETLYWAFFNRPSDPQGKKHWCNQLAAGNSRNSIVDGFIGSPEWSNLCDKFGIQAK